MRGGLHCHSIYPRDAIGAAGESLCLREEMGAAFRVCSGSLCIGGDWNIMPQTLTDI